MGKMCLGLLQLEYASLLEGVRAGGGGTAGEEGVDLGRGENADGDGAAAANGDGRGNRDGDGGGSVEPNLDVLVPQKGYFWNKRFWWDKALFSETGQYFNWCQRGRQTWPSGPVFVAYSAS